MTTVLQGVPAKIVAGDVVRFRVQYADFTPSDGTLLWQLHGSNSKAKIQGLPDGDAWILHIKPEETTFAAAGQYLWAMIGVDDVQNSQERRTLEQGRLEVEPDYLASGPLDGRTHARKVLDSIRAVIEARATKDQASYTIGGRSLSRTPIKDLIELEQLYARRVQNEEGQAAADRGEPRGNKIRGVFSNG